ncbi:MULTISPECIES: VOC family protein [Actinoalloteichus]|uniref:Lactoylglutathione lyase family protein n=1 Tax=Actinoalloteichus fjordicus TaxID=1612552 RepID=A0AAC9L9I2_9PSEU|nr:MULTISPECIES: VOC family protein [Actinoalloteichus]APU12527.1 lactoylglutathione lyase family protein [Actinoalloteichus fjordicus]APU18481.1 lactoylglutathione lyase family protein [Actinoalloteichus sp. GBA129-24]
MSEVTANQPTGTPTWIDLGIPDLARGIDFYRAVFGWEFVTGPPETGNYTICQLRGKAVAGLMANPDADAADFWWSVYLATDDCDATVERVVSAGGTIVNPAMDVMDQGRMAIVRDPAGSQFGLWQGRALVGAQLVNEPNSLVRNDLMTQNPEPTAEFYASVFGFTPERNTQIPGMEFLSLIRPDGHDVGGIFAADGTMPTGWDTTFEVSDVDAAVQRVVAAGGQASTPEDFPFGRLSMITDPFGARFGVHAMP